MTSWKPCGDIETKRPATSWMSSFDRCVANLVSNPPSSKPYAVPGTDTGCQRRHHNRHARRAPMALHDARRSRMLTTRTGPRRYALRRHVTSNVARGLQPARGGSVTDDPAFLERAPIAHRNAN